MMPKNTTKDKLRRPSERITRVLASNIRAFREIRGLSQEALAEMCSCHRTYIGSVERGERNVTLSTLELIADAFGVSVPDLLTEEGIKNSTEK
ncbi:helix-turn-helix domain-containing protein [Prosthecochloris ethylica]|nr:helix-turn-helix transcriptional regulator [Prosthecochloris ethylica]